MGLFAIRISHMRVRRRFWLEAALAALSGILTTAIVLWPDRIGRITGFDPNQQPWAVVAVIAGALGVAAIELASAAWSEWRRSPPTSI
jgi:hypothetical protein